MAAPIKSVVRSIFSPGLFRGKVAIVTGGGTGIGRAVTLELLYLGCKVMIASRNAERLKQAAEEMQGMLGTDRKEDICHVECNIRKEDQVQNMVSSTVSKFGRVDLLVNNGGGQFFQPTGDVSLKGWNAVVDTNLTGTFLCCREAFNQWMKDNGGSIVNITTAFWNGVPTMVHSAAARAGVDNLTKSLAIEWAHNGVRINSVAPGRSIYTESAIKANPIYKEFFKVAAMDNPTKRNGTPEEVSAAVCFLLSPAASFISGESIRVDGAGSIGGGQSIFTISDHDKIPAYTWEDTPPSKL